MSLTVKVIERLFARLATTYGEQFLRQWGASPIADVKTTWAHELSPFANRLEMIAWALENLPERAPNAIVFRNLVRSAPRLASEDVPLPSGPPADPARIAAELEKLGVIRTAVVLKSSNGRDWARVLDARIKAGYKATKAQRDAVRDALAVDEYNL